ncbi:MAG: TAXI family TRAP transporter solute-binding subunit [Clostridia bacterium]|nr:TAXI family TRAP transporter solute-binding subunit [Clostridia bacterium]
MAEHGPGYRSNAWPRTGSPRRLGRVAVGLLAAVSLLLLSACGGGTAGTGARGGSAPPAAGGASGGGSGGGSSGGQAAGGGRKVLLTFGSTDASSSYYAWSVAAGNAINEQVPNVQVTVIETGGGTDNARRLMAGEIAIGIAASNTGWALWNGKAEFEGKPFPDLRVLLYFATAQMNYIVAKDSGITDLEQLNGKKFSLGGSGTSTEKMNEQIFRLLGIQVDTLRGSMTDAQDAFANRQIVGLVKYGKPPDSYVQQVMATVPVHLVSLRDDQIQKITAGIPYLRPGEVPGGIYPGVGGYKTVQGYTGVLTTKNLPEDVGYAIVKALVSPKGKGILDAAYPPGRDEDILKNTVEGADAPLHAGVVRFLKEQGVDVPARLIPPEFRE